MHAKDRRGRAGAFGRSSTKISTFEKEPHLPARKFLTLLEEVRELEEAFP